VFPPFYKRPSLAILPVPMGLLINILLGLYVVDALLMVLVILMQRPKSEGLGAAFGGGVTENIFGAQTTNVLVKVTGWLAAIFFLLTFALSILYAHKSNTGSTLGKELTKGMTPAPAVSATPVPGASASGTPAAAGSATAGPSGSPGASPSASVTGTTTPATAISPATSATASVAPATTPASSAAASVAPAASPVASPSASASPKR
jgi:preprotein translocase subunit SecG